MKVDFLSADYKAAISTGENILAGSAASAAGLDELYYLLGLSYLKDGNYLRASDIFEIIIKELKGASFKEEAMLGLGDSYFLQGNFNKAEGYYGQLAKNGADSRLKAQAYCRLSQVGFKEGDNAKAKDYLDKVRQYYPLNLEIRTDRDIYTSANIFYSVQVGSFSNGDNARKLVRKLSDEGYLAYLEEAISEGKTIFRVRAGKLNTRQEAEALEGKLSQEGYPTKIFP